MSVEKIYQDLIEIIKIILVESITVQRPELNYIYIYV